MEPQSQSIVTYEYLKKKNLVTLIRILALNLSCHWDALPWAQKNYGMIKQIFDCKFCKSGHSADLAFEYIHQRKLYFLKKIIQITLLLINFFVFEIVIV